MRIVKEQDGKKERLRLHLLGMKSSYQCLAADVGSPCGPFPLSFSVTSCPAHCSAMNHEIIKLWKDHVELDAFSQ